MSEIIYKNRARNQKAISLTGFENNGRISMNLQKGFKIDGKWRNQSISFFPAQIPEAYQLLKEIVDSAEKMGIDLTKFKNDEQIKIMLESLQQEENKTTTESKAEAKASASA